MGKKALKHFLAVAVTVCLVISFPMRHVALFYLKTYPYAVTIARDSCVLPVGSLLHSQLQCQTHIYCNTQLFSVHPAVWLTILDPWTNGERDVAWTDLACLYNLEKQWDDGGDDDNMPRLHLAVKQGHAEFPPWLVTKQQQWHWVRSSWGREES